MFLELIYRFDRPQKNVQNYPVATTNYMKQHGRIQTERWDGSFEYPRQVFVVKKPSYMSFTHSYREVWNLLFFVYFLQENIAMKTADRRSSLFKILKYFL